MDKKISEITDKLNRFLKSWSNSENYLKNLKLALDELSSEVEELQETVQALEAKISKL